MRECFVWVKDEASNEIESVKAMTEKSQLDYSALFWSRLSPYWRVRCWSKAICGRNPASYMYILRKSIWSDWISLNSEKDKHGQWKCTSVIGPFQVEPCRIKDKIFRSRLLGPIVHFADFLTDDEIEALTRDLFITSDKTFRQFNIAGFKGVASEEHSSNGFFLWLTMGSSLKYTNPGH